MRVSGQPRALMQPRKATREEIEQLACYNAECGRGIMHTEEWDAIMAGVQYMFDWYRDES